MKTIVHIELTDEQRTRLFAMLNPTATRAGKLSRKQVQAIATGLFDALTAEASISDVPARTRTRHEPTPHEPHNAAYMRGWNNAGRIINAMKRG